MKTTPIEDSVCHHPSCKGKPAKWRITWNGDSSYSLACFDHLSELTEDVIVVEEATRVLLSDISAEDNVVPMKLCTAVKVNSE